MCWVWSSLSASDSLENLIGLHRAKNAIKQVALGGTGVQSVLLYGSQGSGKTALADFLTQAWLCKDPIDGKPCDSCSACRTFAQERNPDFQRIAPYGLSRMINVGVLRRTKNPSETPDSIIPLNEYFRSQPMVSSNKVVQFNDVDRMNAKAFNSLLKTLEEPPRFGRLILSTEHLSQIPTTIQSRCLSLPCELPTPEEIRIFEPGLSDAVAALSQSAPGLVRDLAAKPEAIGALWNFALSLSGRPPGSALVASEEFQTVCGMFLATEDSGVRAANSHTLQLLAQAVHSLYPERSTWVQAISETHRRVTGNGNASMNYDCMFAQLLSH